MAGSGRVGACGRSFCQGKGDDPNIDVECMDDNDCDVLADDFEPPCAPAEGPCTFDDNADLATKTVEIWDPDTGQWCNAAAQEVERMYHSTALLLPDGSVISMGNGQRQGLVNQRNAEIYQPPYLYKDGGNRPVVTFPASGEILGGEDLTILLDTSNGAPEGNEIARVTMVKLGSVTHQFDMAQRFVELNILGKGTNSVTVDVPSTANTPRGWYMLFVFSEGGVPSVAPYVKL